MKRILVLIFVVQSVLGYAQGEELFVNKEVIVTGIPRSVIRTQKPVENPVSVDTVIAVPEMRYTNIPGSAETEYEPEKFSPVKATEKLRLAQLYRFYAKAGIGNYTMPYAELIINDLYNKKGTYGLMMKHHSSSGGLKDVGYSGFSDNEIGIYGKRFIKKYELGGEFDYKRNVVHYYGFNPDSFSLAKDVISQRYQYAGGKAYLGTFHPDSVKINHREEIQFYYFNSITGASEKSV